MLMYREDYYDKETMQKEMTEIHVAKHRNGPVGSFKLRFMKEFGRFVEGDDKIEKVKEWLRMTKVGRLYEQEKQEEIDKALSAAGMLLRNEYRRSG